MKKAFKWILIVIVVLFVIGLVAGNDDTETEASQNIKSSENNVVAEQEAEPVTATPVNASDLFADYDSNEVAADKKYKGQLLEVSGTVSSIDSGLGDSAMVQLETSNQFMHVTAKGNDEFTSAAASLTKGQKITMICEGDGEVIGMPMLSDCVIQ